MEETHHQTPRPHIVILSTAGMGHVIPLTELAKQLVLLHNFSITFIIPPFGSPSTAMISVLDDLPPENINYTFLRPVNLDDQPKDARVETLIALTVSRSLPYLREEFKIITATKRVVALIVDLFATDALDVAKEFDVSPYIVFPSSAMSLLLFFDIPNLHESYSGEFRDLPEPLQLPGCAPCPGPELLYAIQDKKNDAYTWILHHSKRYNLADGILLNSFIDLEQGAMRALMKEEPGKPPVYPVGPLIQRHLTNRVDESGCLKWLDKQPRGSVLFVSFGSGGTLSYEQLIELAYGLEMSGQRFLWVVRGPNATAKGTYLSHSSNDPFDFLPDGYLDRTKGSGLLVHSWAPQIQILSHGSTGGFLSHCGWNSTLESIVYGVPMIAWPLFAEQKMNAIMLVEDVRVALRPRANENGFIGREEIAWVVRILIEGEEGKSLGNKMRELKEAAATVLRENGSSTKSLFDVAQKWKNNNKTI
ncbi:UDP-glucuronosyl/UDP-glucosyltransferase [Macleaya cordata]|uniref:Glycosyltransferase n=1 Tax=Macleaya cordata TaxID=56857 RepID=A0A200PRI8_MACCD|nr:UDP-glucuronosyl/UDP-glucosyltransferase [Macleaya cordata]